MKKVMLFTYYFSLETIISSNPFGKESASVLV